MPIPLNPARNLRRGGSMFVMVFPPQRTDIQPADYIASHRSPRKLALQEVEAGWRPTAVGATRAPHWPTFFAL
jgi:hypothetical protein